jgi:hypothetical protein
MSPLKMDWTQPLTHLDEAAFLSMHLENKLTIVHLLKAIQIHGSFFLTPTHGFTSFQEQDISVIA